MVSEKDKKRIINMFFDVLKIKYSYLKEVLNRLIFIYLWKWTASDVYSNKIRIETSEIERW